MSASWKSRWSRALDTLDWPTVKQLIECTSSKPKNFQFKNNLALRLASKHNQSDIVLLLLRTGAVNCKAKENEAFFNIVKNGNLDLLKHLFLLVNFKSRNHFALHLAIRKKHWHIFDYLIATVYKDCGMSEIGSIIFKREKRPGWLFSNKEIQRKIQPYLIAHFKQTADTFDKSTLPKYHFSLFLGPWEVMRNPKTVLGQQARALVLQEHRKFLHNVTINPEKRLLWLSMKWESDALNVMTVKPLLDHFCKKWRKEQSLQEKLSPFGFIKEACSKKQCITVLGKTLTKKSKAILLGLGQLDLPTLLLTEILSSVHEPISNCIDIALVYKVCNVVKITAQMKEQ